MMRTTVNIDDDVLRAAKGLAKSENRSLGEVVSELMRRGLRPRAYVTETSEFPVFLVSEEAAPITSEMVRQALDEDD
jgi:hypothetical protein